MYVHRGPSRDIADHRRHSMSIPFTATQGQYLAFIHAYTTLHRRSPAERDFQDFFRCSVGTSISVDTARGFLPLYSIGIAISV